MIILTLRLYLCQDGRNKKRKNILASKRFSTKAIIVTYKFNYPFTPVVTTSKTVTTGEKSPSPLLIMRLSIPFAQNIHRIQRFQT